MTASVLPRGPDRGRLGPDALARLASRNILDINSPDFAQNQHFDRLHCSPFPNHEKPAVLFTACPHDLFVHQAAVSDEFVEWAGSPTTVKVDGQRIPALGLVRVTLRPLLVVEKHHKPSPPSRDILMYREFAADGFCEHGASSLFFGLNTLKNIELRLCYTVGEFWVYLAYLRMLYSTIGMRYPFTVFLSIRKSCNLVLGNYGNEVFNPSWDIPKHWSVSPDDPSTDQRNIQLRHTFNSVDEMTDGEIARATKEAAARICEVYSAGPPKCYDDGVFAWKLWKHTRHETVRRNQP